MLKRSFLLSFRRLAISTPSVCASCRRTFQISAALRIGDPARKLAAAQGLQPTPAVSEPPQNEKDFTPKPLGRPIGFSNPPVPGENSGSDPRSWGQRKADFVDWEKHLKRRQELARRISKPYFRDFTQITKYHKGKHFLANPRLFKADVALFFPNLQGITVAQPKAMSDTTTVLHGKISVVSIFSSVWGEAQARTFTDAKQNPELAQILQENGQRAQLVEINIEQNAFKFSLLRLFMYNLRRGRSHDQQGRYFIVRRGVSDLVRESIGLLNGRVGYTYLLDEECRVRWAACGDAEGEEKDQLVKGLRWLLAEVAGHKKKQKPVTKQNEVNCELETQTATSASS